MRSIPKVVGVLSCGFLLCLGLSTIGKAGNADFAAGDMNADQSFDQKNEQTEQEMGDQLKDSHLQSGKSLKGEVLRVENGNYFVRGNDGKEVRLHTDHSTRMAGDINQGDRIEANVNDLNYALSIRAESTDRRNEKSDGSADSTREADKAGSMGQ
jgi:hypothetical protein